MNQPEGKLIDTAIYNLVMATGNPEMKGFVTGSLLPFVEESVAPALAVISDGGRKTTASVLQETLLDLEDQLKISFEDEKGSAMMYALLFLTAATFLRNTSLAAELGISKSGFFRPRWKS